MYLTGSFRPLIDSIPRQTSKEINNKTRFQVPEGDEPAIVNQMMGVRVAIGKEKVYDNIEEKGKLASNV